MTSTPGTPSRSPETPLRILVTGASGFVGAALVPRLLDRGHEVVCLVRDPARLTAWWRDRVEVVAGTADHSQAVLRAAGGCAAALYLVHGMATRTDGLAERESATAAAFRDGAELAGVRRIVYLGGLVDEDRLAATSEHLYARTQTGHVLRDGLIGVTELRAGIVLGEGSASFHLLRLASRSPLQVQGPWAASRCQPVAERDLLALLTAAVEDRRADGDLVLDVGGPDIVTYGGLVAMVRAAEGRAPALRLTVPWLPPELVALVTANLAGLDPSLSVSLLSSARVDAVVRDDGGAGRRYPATLVTPLEVAVPRALGLGRVAVEDRGHDGF